MSSSDDKAPHGDAGPSTGASLVPVLEEKAFAGPHGPARPNFDVSGGRRWIAPVMLIALTGAVGWFAGAHSGLSASVSTRTAVESSIVSELKAQSAALAALEDRLRSVEAAPRADATLKPAIDILAQRIDEIARKQTAALTQTSSRLDRSDKDMAVRLDRLSERIDRLEKQVSSEAPVGSVQKNVTAVTRSAPEAAKADETVEKALRGYVLRDVFRGGALVESRYGLMEAFPGVQLPGAGRVRSVEKRDGRWVVVTTAGLIESRR